MDFLPEVIGGDESPSEEEQTPNIKPQLREEDVFDIEPSKKSQLKIHPVKSDEPEPEPEPILPESNDVGGLDKPEETPQKKPRKKRVMTEEQKAKLAIARKKALAVRQEKARKKREIKELKSMQLDNELDELKKTIKPKAKPIKIEPVERDILPKEPEPPPPPLVRTVSKAVDIPKQRMYTQDDVDNITLKAISNYDEIRKVRKQQKAKQRQEEQIKNRERQKLMNIISDRPKYDSSNEYWGNCF